MRIGKVVKVANRMCRDSEALSWIIAYSRE